MTREQLIALRTAVCLSEIHIRNYSRGKNTLEWTKVLRKAKQAIREITHEHISGPMCPKCGTHKLQCPDGHTWDISK